MDKPTENDGFHVADEPLAAIVSIAGLLIMGRIALITTFLSMSLFTWLLMLMWGAFCTDGFRATRRKLSAWFA